MNIAAVHRLPVVFICENNGYAISVPESMQMAAPVSTRAAGYGMPGATLDGTDADAVHEAAVGAVGRARAGGGPSLLELCVPRLVPHSSQDDDKYRSDADRAAAAARDPLTRLRARLVAEGVADTAALDAEDAVLREQVRSEAERALEAPDPEPARARRWMYAGDGR